MFSSPRKSASLKMFETLEGRYELPPKERTAFKRLQQGYEGEKHFSELLSARVRNHCIPIFDLGLKPNGNECQLDALLIFQTVIYHLEIKNLKGDYYTENNRWFLSNNKEIQNPLNQLSRSKLIIQEFLTQYKCTIPIRSQIIFMNPEFYLFQAPMDLPAIFPAHLHRFIQQLEKTTSTLNPYHERLAKYLTAAHVLRSKHESLPEYKYDQIKKGLFCKKCRSPLGFFSPRKLICKKCEVTCNSESVIMQSVTEFNLLFPEKPITVSSIHHWSRGMISKDIIKRILLKNLKLVPKGNSSYYSF